MNSDEFKLYFETIELCWVVSLDDHENRNGGVSTLVDDSIEYFQDVIRFKLTYSYDEENIIDEYVLRGKYPNFEFKEIPKDCSSEDMDVNFYPLQSFEGDNHVLLIYWGSEFAYFFQVEKVKPELNEGVIESPIVLKFDDYPSHNTIDEIGVSNPSVMIDLSGCDSPIDDSWNVFSDMIYGAHIQIDCLDPYELNSFVIPKAKILKISFTKGNPFSTGQEAHEAWFSWISNATDFKKIIFDNIPSWEKDDIRIFIQLLADTRRSKTLIQLPKSISRPKRKGKGKDIQKLVVDLFNKFGVFELV